MKLKVEQLQNNQKQEQNLAQKTKSKVANTGQVKIFFHQIRTVGNPELYELTK